MNMHASFHHQLPPTELRICHISKVAKMWERLDLQEEWSIGDGGKCINYAVENL